MNERYATCARVVSYSQHMLGEAARSICSIDGKTERRLALKLLSRDDVLEQLALIQLVKFGKAMSNKKRKHTEVELNWTK